MLSLKLGWDDVYKKTIELFKEYIRINTTNPPGNEMEAALFFANIFERAGIPHKIYESQEKRGSIMAVLEGEGKGSIILLNHMDVVPVEEDKWDYPPFGAVEDGGFIYGRGALDMKSFGIIQMASVLLLKNSGKKLSRDIIFLGCADEERGGAKGVNFLVSKIPQLQDASFCINEGGKIWKGKNGKLVYHVAFTEKIPVPLKIVARGKAGHGSVPPVEHCNLKLIEALHRINQWRGKFRITPITKRILDAYISIYSGNEKLLLEKVAKDPSSLSQEEIRLLEEKEPYISSLLKDTISLNVISSGSKTNVVPSEGYALYDCRILPDTPHEEFQKSILSLVEGLDVDVEFLPTHRPVPKKMLESEDSEYYKAVKKVAYEFTPEAVVIPSMMTGASDSQYFRSIGVPTYGFAPFIMDKREKGRVHGHNERISVENLKFGLRFMYRLLDILT